MPFDRAKYPKDWPAIRRRIRERDGDRCTVCGVPNGSYRLTYPDGHEVVTTDPMYVEAACYDGATCARIVLTVAHYPDPDPANVADDNLQALCQRHHNRLDGRMRAGHAAETRRVKRVAAGQIPLLGDTP